VRRFGPLFLFFLLLTAPAEAASTGGSDHFDVTLVSEEASIRPGRPFYVGLRMEPEHGWHTYWKNPGDAGLPLSIHWTLPRGFAAGPIEWPAPVRFETGPLVSYGYAGEVLLAVRITPPDQIESKKVTIAGKFDWLECEEICVPASATLDLALPVREGEPKPSATARLFAEARAVRPASPEGWRLTAEAGPRAVSLTIAPPSGRTPRSGYFFSDQELVADYAGAQGFEHAGAGYRLTFPPAPNHEGFPERLTGVLALEGAGVDGARLDLAVDLPLRAGDPAPAAAGASAAGDGGAGSNGAEPERGAPGAAGSPRLPTGAFAAGIVALAGLGFIFLKRSRRNRDT
jgi:thiol:disulfide interchange protein DsbD